VDLSIIFGWRQTASRWVCKTTMWICTTQYWKLWQNWFVLHQFPNHWSLCVLSEDYSLRDHERDPQKHGQSGQEQKYIEIVRWNHLGTGKDCLVFRLFCHEKRLNFADWGHEYVTHLSGEIVSNWPEGSDEFRQRLVSLIQLSLRSVDGS
jgi:hypothetical protein